LRIKRVCRTRTRKLGTGTCRSRPVGCRNHTGIAGRRLSGGAVTPPAVPVVLSSTIDPTNPDGIVVQFDQQMTLTCDIKDQINVIVDGAAPIHPLTVVHDVSDPAIWALTFPTDFVAGQVITWAYDDQAACDWQSLASGIEIDNQTYGVTNNAGVAVPAVVSSVIAANNPHRILVEWSEDMQAEPNAHFGIAIVIDGASPIIPSALTVTGKYIAMAMPVPPAPITNGQVVSWSYNKNNPDEKISGKATGQEPYKKSHDVVNNVPVVVSSDNVLDGTDNIVDGTDNIIN